MPKKAISVTLESENLMWLKARTRSGRGRSVSDVLDRLVTEARTHGAPGEMRSVVGSIDVDPADPLLLNADEAIRTLFAESLERPFMVKDKRAPHGRRSRTPRG